MCSLHLTPGEQWGFDALLKCLTSVMDNSRFEPTTSGYKSDALSIRPQLPIVVDELRRAQESWTLPVSELNNDINTVQFLSQNDNLVI